MIKAYLKGAEKVKAIIAQMISRGENIKPLQREISAIMHNEVDENFQAGGRDPSWPVSKRAQKQGGQTLIDKGQLLGSIQEFISGNSSGVSTNKAYAAIHNFGGQIKRHPFSMRIKLRTDAKGNLLRQGTEGLKANLAVFAKSSHKRTATRTYTSNGWTINMPQREFMKVSPAGIGKIEAAAAAFLIPA